MKTARPLFGQFFYVLELILPVNGFVFPNRILHLHPLLKKIKTN